MLFSLFLNIVNATVIPSCTRFSSAFRLIFANGKRACLYFRYQKKHFSRPADSIIVNSSTRASTRFVPVDSSNRHECASFSLTYVTLFIDCFLKSRFFIFLFLVISYSDPQIGNFLARSLNYSQKNLTSMTYSIRRDVDIP